MDRLYDAGDWYWIVANDESRYWSSAAGAYVDALPDGAGVTRILNEEELGDVLAVYGLPGPGYPIEAAAADLVALLAGATASILAAYPEGERLSWDAKEGEAIAFMAAEAPIGADYQLLRGEVAAERAIAAGDVTLDQIAEKAETVLWMASQWRALVSALSGLRKRFKAAIDVAEDDAGRRAVVGAAQYAIAALKA